MRTSARFLVLALVLGLFSRAATAEPCAPADRAGDLDAFVRATLAANGVPGCAAVVIDGGRVTWSGAWGLADLATRRPVRVDSLFQVASVSKTMVAVAAMQLVEEKKLRLDDDVGRFVPFRVRNPVWPARPITVRMLMTHTSGLLDDWEVLERVSVMNRDSALPLGRFLRIYLTPGRPNEDEIWSWAAPGEESEYSNVGVALLAYVVERVAKRPFDEVCRARIFEPLGMKDTHWRVADVPKARIAWPYVHEEDGWKTEGLYGGPDYPDAMLVTTAPDLAKFLICLASGGTLDGARILRRETVTRMFEVQNERMDDDQALVWYWSELEDGTEVVGHGGSYEGIATGIAFDPESGRGVVVLMNGDGDDGDPVEEVFERLYADAP